MIKEQEAGEKTADVCWRHGISPATFYKYKSKCGGMDLLAERGIETIRTIKHGHVHAKRPEFTGEIGFVEYLFGHAV